jgi:SNF2 family DNA or RNA helicase
MIVYYANNFDLEARMQSEERAQAVGKADPVAYVDLQVPGTIDEKIVKMLREKINLSSTLMGDAWKAWLI